MVHRGPYKQVTQTDVAKTAGVSRSTAAAILLGTRDGEFSEETIRKVRQAAKELGYMQSGFRRTVPRKEVKVSVDVKVLLRKPRREFTNGTALLTDLSDRGFSLRNVNFASKTIPQDPFTVEIVSHENGPVQGVLKGFPIRLRFLRGTLEMGFKRV